MIIDILDFYCLHLFIVALFGVFEVENQYFF